MDLGALVASLPAKNGVVYAYDKGKTSEHPYSLLTQDVARAIEDLRRWRIQPGHRVGIFAPNCYHWLVYDLAIVQIGAVSVPFTDDFAGKLDAGLLDKYGIALLLISRNGRGAPQKQPWIAYLDVDNENVEALPRVADADPDDLSMAFSSGSAGGLKGLLISRKGLEATLPPIYEAVGTRSGDRLLLFMPMSNFQQRIMCYAAIWYDFDIVITDYVHLPGSIKSLQPTLLVAPPMYFQMIYTRFLNFPAAKKALWAVLGSAIALIPGAALRRALAARFFTEIHQQFGGRMRILMTGMAPIKRDVVKFFNMMQLPLCESYGMVETGSLTYRPPRSRKYGSVGKPVHGITLQFNDDGEVVVERDHFLTRRYFQCADGENERTFLGANRVATGDIGRLDSDGYLYLLGRKKELIITPGGYKIHPEIVERELAGCPDIAQAAVFLKPGTANLVCIASLNQPQSEDARARVRGFVKAMKTTKASQIADVIFTDAPFSTENGMLRPNLKLDRRAIAARYALN